MKVEFIGTLNDISIDEIVKMISEPGITFYVTNEDGVEIPFTVIDVAADKKTCVITQSGMIKERPFQETRRTDGKNPNVYEGSDIQKYLKWEYREQFPEEFLRRCGEFNLLPADAYDPDETPYEWYKNRKHITKYDEDGYAAWFWTSTPHVGSASNVRHCPPSGYAGSSNTASDSHGVVPACTFNLES